MSVLRELEEDIRSQPSLLAATLDTAGCEPPRRHASRILFTGCGDSLHAAIAAAHLAGGTAVEPYDLSRRPDSLRAGTLLVAISYSGRVRSTAEAAALARERGARVLAVTSRSDSPLASHADDVALLPVRASERPLPGMSSYLMCMLAAMMPFADDRELERVPSLVGSALESPLPPVEPAPCFVGSLHNRATALYAAAKLAEVTGAAAHACHTEEFFHVELFLLERSRPVVLFASPSDPKLTAVWRALRARGFAASLVGPGPECDVPIPDAPDQLLPLLNCVPVQRAVLASASASRLSSWSFLADTERLAASDELIY